MSTSSWTYVSEVVPCWDWSSRSEVLGFHFCKENCWKPGQSSTTSTGAIACRCVWPHKDASPSWKGQGARAQGGDHLGNDGGGSKLYPSPTLLQICGNYAKTMVNERWRWGSGPGIRLTCVPPVKPEVRSCCRHGARKTTGIYSWHVGYEWYHPVSAQNSGWCWLMLVDIDIRLCLFHMTMVNYGYTIYSEVDCRKGKSIMMVLVRPTWMTNVWVG